jgi:hypothetical protein
MTRHGWFMPTGSKITANPSVQSSSAFNVSSHNWEKMIPVGPPCTSGKPTCWRIIGANGSPGWSFPAYLPETWRGGLRDRKMQRALMQFFKPENYFEVREALTQAGVHDLIDGGAMR